MNPDYEIGLIFLAVIGMVILGFIIGIYLAVLDRKRRGSK